MLFFPKKAPHVVSAPLGEKIKPRIFISERQLALHEIAFKIAGRDSHGTGREGVFISQETNRLNTMAQLLGEELDSGVEFSRDSKR